MELPLAKYPLLRTRTIDEANDAFNRLYRCPTEIQKPSPGSQFQWHVNGISLGRMRIVVGWIDNDIVMTSESSPESVVLYFARAGTALYHQHGQEFRTSTQQGVVIAPHGAWRLVVPGGFGSLTLTLDYTTLADTLYALTGSYSAKRLEFDPFIDKQTPHGGEIIRLLDFIVQTLERDPSPLAHPLVLGNLQNAFLTGLLCAQPHNHRQLLEKGVATPSIRAVQTAEAYLDAHADKAITMAELQAVTGMSVRSIQAGFKAKRGCSPMEFLRERRLLMAQQRLKKATGSTTVAEVAYSCGFGHLGRFSRDYHKRFGEKPSETLDQALQDQRGSVGRTVMSKLTGSRP